MLNADYLSYLKNKERKLISHKLNITHGHISATVRCVKGYILGFGLANIFISANKALDASMLFFVVISIFISVFFIHNEVREYKRMKLFASIKKACFILICSAIPTLLVLLYSNLVSYLFVLSIVNLFTAISYSME